MSISAKTRLAFFLALSVLLHLFLAYVLARLPAHTPHPPADRPLRVELVETEEPGTEEHKLLAREPKLFDLMEVQEALSDVPASLSKIPHAPSQPPGAPPPQPHPPSPERIPEPETLATRDEPAGKPLERAIPQEPYREEVTRRRLAETPREPPPVRDLIPSISDILAMRSPRGSLYRHDTVHQDGIGERQARALFDEYLAEFKSRVMLNWRVLDDPYMHESTTVLLIVINGDGTLGSLSQLQSSGMPGQDTQALYAVRNSLPMRPPPDILLDEAGRLTIRFSFHFLVRSTLGPDQPGRAALGSRRPWRPDPTCVPPCIRW